MKQQNLNNKKTRIGKFKFGKKLLQKNIASIKNEYCKPVISHQALNKLSLKMIR